MIWKFNMKSVSERRQSSLTATEIQDRDGDCENTPDNSVRVDPRSNDSFSEAFRNYKEEDYVDAEYNNEYFEVGS